MKDLVISFSTDLASSSVDQFLSHSTKIQVPNQNEPQKIIKIIVIIIIVIRIIMIII